jgi:glycosyltransferase involved in cell wall biosynthesis
MQIGIVYETTYPEFKGGVERWFSELAKKLSENSFHVSYLNTIGRVSQEKNLEYKEIGNSKYAFHKTGERKSSNALVFAFSVFRGVRQEKYDIVYLSAFPFLHIWTARIAQKLFRRKFKIYVEWFELPKRDFWIEEFGTLVGLLGYSIQQLSVRISDVNVCYLQSTYDQLNHNKKSRESTLKLPGICMDSEHSNHQQVILGREDISQIGRLTKDKQPILGLETVKQLRENGWNGHFHLVGSGPLESDVRAFIKDNNMNQYVTAYGDVTEQSKWNILDKTAVLLHPSKREGFGLAIVEAAAAGIPAVLIRGANNKSTELGINPSLVSETNDSSELASLLKHALQKQEEYSAECLTWNRDVRTTMRAENSIAALTNHLNSL